jgi:hypothetical protein
MQRLRSADNGIRDHAKHQASIIMHHIGSSICGFPMLFGVS